MIAKIVSVEKHDNYNEIIFRSDADYEFTLFVDKAKKVVTVEKYINDKIDKKPYYAKVYHGTFEQVKSRFGSVNDLINAFY